MKRAVVIGINDYPNAPLAGCEFDAMQVSEYLKDNCGFGPGCVRLLLGARATREEIWDRLVWGVTESEPGDELVISYSGHGATEAVRDVSGRIVRMQQVLCPVDFQWGKLHTKITDGDWVNVMSRIPQGVRCVAILDSCYSGGMSERKRVRAVANLLTAYNLVTDRLYPVPSDIDHRNRDAIDLGLVPGSFGSDALNMACIMGCGEGQKSVEASIDGKVRGALTYHLLKAMDRMPGEKLDAVMAQVVSDMHQGGYLQIPCIFGMQSGKSFLWR